MTNVHSYKLQVGLLTQLSYSVRIPIYIVHHRYSYEDIWFFVDASWYDTRAIMPALVDWRQKPALETGSCNMGISDRMWLAIPM